MSEPGDAKRVFVGDKNVTFEFDVGEDLTGATVRKGILTKPSGTTVEVDGSLVGDPTDGIFSCLYDDVFDQEGLWKRQAKVTWGAVQGPLKGDVTEFVVYK